MWNNTFIYIYSSDNHFITWQMQINFHFFIKSRVKNYQKVDVHAYLFHL